MLESLITFAKDLLAKEAARVVALATAGATAAALKLAELAGITLAPEFVVAIGLFAAAVATEVIRHLVYSQATHEAELEAAKTA